MDIRSIFSSPNSISEFETLRKDAKVILQDEDLLWSLVDSIPDAVLVQKNNLIVHCNTAAVDLFGFKDVSDLLGQDSIHFAHPDDQRDINIKRQKFKTDEAKNYVSHRRHRRVDGTEFLSMNFVTKLGPSHDFLIVVILKDISEPIATQRALKLGEQQFQRSFEDANIGMMIIQPDSKIRHANNAMCQMLGYTLEEIRSISAMDLSHPEDKSSEPIEIQKMKNGEIDNFKLEKRFLTKNGETVWVSINSSMVFDHYGKPSHSICQAEDVTDRKSSETALEKYQCGLTGLHEISSDHELSHEERILQVLELGTIIFELPIGFVGKIDDKNYMANFAVGPNAKDMVGISISSEQSYCYHTYLKDTPMGYHNVSDSPLATEPCYETLGFESYLGTPLYVGGEKFGTVCFVGNEALSRPFDEYQYSFLKLLSQWIGGEIHRHQIELKRQDELNKYKALTQYAGDAVIVRDDAGNILEVNDTTCIRLGYTRDELLSMKAWEIVPSMGENFSKRNLGAFDTGGVIVSQLDHKRKDGTTFPIEASVVKYTWNEENRFIITARDISDRLKETNALLESEERFRRLFEDSSAGMMLMSLDGIVSDVNKSFCQILGYTSEEVVGNSIKDLVPDEEKPETQSAFDNLETGTQLEKKFIHKNGSTIWCLLSRTVIHDTHGKPLYRLGQFRDISEQRRIEIELKKQKELQDLVGQISIAANDSEDIDSALKFCLTKICQFNDWQIGHAFVLKEKNSDFLESSKTWYFSDEEKYSALKKTSDSLKVTSFGVLQKRVVTKSELLWRHVDPSQFSGEFTEELIRLNLHTSIKVPIIVGKSSVGVLEFFSEKIEHESEPLRDTLLQIGTQIGRVIERSQAKEKLLTAKQSAEIGSRAKSEFLANMSHELRSPLTAILGFTETMQSEIFGPIANQKYIDYLDNIYKSAEHLHDIINDVLDVSAIEAGELNMREETFELSTVANAAIRMVNPKAEQTGVILLNEIDENSPAINGDERRIKQILVNLLSNSVRFTPRDGTAKLSFDVSKNGDINIYVKDTGIGMDLDGINKALSVFGQVESDFTRNYDGTGLGLPLAKSLIEAHGGALSITSIVDEGTTVKLTLPKARIVPPGYSI